MQIFLFSLKKCSKNSYSNLSLLFEKVFKKYFQIFLFSLKKCSKNTYSNLSLLFEKVFKNTYSNFLFEPNFPLKKETIFQNWRIIEETTGGDRWNLFSYYLLGQMVWTRWSLERPRFIVSNVPVFMRASKGSNQRRRKKEIKDHPSTRASALANPFLSACGDLKKEMKNGRRRKKNVPSFNGKRVISYWDAIKGKQCGFAQLSE